MLNKYLDRLHKLIDEYRRFDLSQFEGPGGAKARFDDLLWYHIDANSGRRTRILCCRHGVKGKGELLVRSRPELQLPAPYDHLLKIWIVLVFNTPISAVEKQARIAAARKFLSLIRGDLHCQTETSVSDLNFNSSVHGRLTFFLSFCADNGFMQKLDIALNAPRDRTGHALFDSNLSKLPSIETILALGDIFRRIFKPVTPDGSLSSGAVIRMRDAMTITFGCLSLASPNRTSAEVTVISKQRLHAYSEPGGDPVYYLDWKGSKGHKDYKNHLLAVLSEPLEKAINFFHEVCEPARILCRFYEKPNQSLKVLLGGYNANPDRLRQLSLTKQPNLFQLGYALGLYEFNESVSVVKMGAEPARFYRARRADCYEKKPIYALDGNDQISTSWNSSVPSRYSSLSQLFRANTNTSPFNDRVTITIDEVQQWWIAYYKSTILPEFPLSYSKGETCIRLADALFCFLGNWFYGERAYPGRGSKGFQSSPYAIVPLRALASQVIARFSGGGAYPSIFEDFGFAPELKLRLHSLRHFANTLADMSELPVEIITAWSGRVNSEQTHTYIHTSHDEKADRVSAVINRPDSDSRDIKIVSAKNLSQATNLPASVTSTGVCTQDLYAMPCNFLNDFVGQCFMCSSACHIAGDEACIAFLEKDHAFQSARLESVENNPRLSNSEAMQRWYIIHSRNTQILSMLIELMQKSPQGTIVRYSENMREFNLSDLNTKSITRVSCALPNPEDRLQQILKQKNQHAAPTPNPQLLSLLSSFGLSTSEP